MISKPLNLATFLQLFVEKLHATKARNFCVSNRPETRASIEVAPQLVACNNHTEVAVLRCAPSLGGATLQPEVEFS